MNTQSESSEGTDQSIYQFPKPKRIPKNTTKAKKDRSKHQERQIAKEYKESGFKAAKRIPGSGAFQGLKGDVDPGEWFLGECKQTRSGRLVVDPQWLDKIESESRNLGRPWYALHAWVGDETSNYRRVVVLNEDHFFQLIKLLKDYEDAS